MRRVSPPANLRACSRPDRWHRPRHRRRLRLPRREASSPVCFRPAPCRLPRRRRSGLRNPRLRRLSSKRASSRACSRLVARRLPLRPHNRRCRIRIDSGRPPFLDRRPRLPLPPPRRLVSSHACSTPLPRPMRRNRLQTSPHLPLRGRLAKRASSRACSNRRSIRRRYNPRRAHRIPLPEDRTSRRRRPRRSANSRKCSAPRTCRSLLRRLDRLHRAHRPHPEPRTSFGLRTRCPELFRQLHPADQDMRNRWDPVTSHR